jgi:hypothetical protein
VSFASRGYGDRWDRGATEVTSGRLPPGKRTLVEQAYRKAAGTTSPVADEHQAAAVTAAAGSGGAPLPAELRVMLERALGVSLAGVRLHDDAAAHAAAAAIGARAYAVGQDIHFAQGAFAPYDAEGRRLIAHEVAHTVQQKSAAAPALPNPAAGEPFKLQAGSPWGSVQGKLAVSQPGDAAEVEADRFADAFVAGQPAAPITAAPAASLHRDQDPKPAPTPPLLKLLGIKVPDPVDIEGAPPPGGGEKVKYASFWWTDNAEFVRFELAEIASRRNLAALDDMPVGFEASLKENPDYFYATASKDDAEKESRRAYLTRVLDVLRVEAKELRFRANQFRELFERRCGDVVRESLIESRTTLEKERERYGIKSESSWVFWTRYSMQDNDATKGMRKAIFDMMGAYGKVTLLDTPLMVGSPEGVANKKQAVAEYNAVRYAKESQFPVLATFDLDAKHGQATAQRLKELHEHDLQEMAERIGADITDKLKNIKTVEEKLSTKKDLVWKLERAHGATLCLADVIADKLTHAGLRQKIVAQKRQEVADDEAFMKAALVALGVALALVPMVGPPAAAATAAVIAGGAVNIAVAAQSIRDAQLTAAAQDTDFNKAKAVLGGEPPSLFWIAMDLIVIGVELKAAAMAVKSIAKLHAAAVTARATARAAEGARAAEAQNQLTEALNRLRAEGNGVKGADGLGQKLVDDVNNGAFAQPGGGAGQKGAAGGAGAAAAPASPGVAFAAEGEAAGIPRWEQQGDFLIAVRTEKGLLMRQSHAEALYFDVLGRNPGREAGILRNPLTGEHIVGYGDTFGFHGPQSFGRGGPWEIVRHYHPYVARTSRVASTADFAGLIGPQFPFYNRPASSVIDWFDAAAGKWKQTTFGFEPGVAEPFWLRFQDEAGGWHTVRFSDATRTGSPYENFVNQYRANPTAIPKDGAMPGMGPGKVSSPPTPLPPGAGPRATAP